MVHGLRDCLGHKPGQLKTDPKGLKNGSYKSQNAENHEKQGLSLIFVFWIIFNGFKRF